MSGTDKHLTGPGPTAVNRNTVVLFSQTQKMAEEMQNHADSLHNAYLSFQGKPYSDPDFNIPDIEIANLPTAAMDNDTFMKQTDETRLKNNLYFYSAIVKFLKLTMDEQKDLNQSEQSLTAKFEEALGDIEALISNISAIMTQLGMSLNITFPDPLVVPYEGKAPFKKKLRGYFVCREYKERVLLTTQDFEFFAKKYQSHL